MALTTVQEKIMSPQLKREDEVAVMLRRIFQAYGQDLALFLKNIEQTKSAKQEVPRAGSPVESTQDSSAQPRVP